MTTNGAGCSINYDTVIVVWVSGTPGPGGIGKMDKGEERDGFTPPT
jgi:hypothetical protein